MNQLFTNIFAKKHRSGNVTWIVRWKDPKTGQWIKRAAGRTENEAKLLEAEVRRDLALGLDPQPKTPEKTLNRNVEEISHLFLKSVKFLTAKPHWQNETRRRLRKDVVPKLGKLKFKDLKRETLFKFYLELKDREISHATLQKYHALMASLGDCYAEVESNGENPIRRMRDFKKYFPRQAPTRKINFLIPEELERLFAASKKSNCALLYPFVKFLAHTGLRRGEALNLRWSDIDGNGDFIYIATSKNGRERRVPLDEGAWEALHELTRKATFIFTKKNGKRYNDRYLLKPLKVAAKEAGLEQRIDLHTLRHSFASNKIRQGWGIKKISVILGHSDISITSRVYTHLLDGDLRLCDDFAFDNLKSSEKDESTDVQKMAKLVQEVISKLGESSEEQVKAAALQAILSLNRSAASYRSSQQRSEPNNKIAAPATITLEKGALVPHMPRRPLKRDVLINSIDPQGEKKAQDINTLSVSLSNFFGVPTGIRTPVTAVKGRCPRPLDDGDAYDSSK